MEGGRRPGRRLKPTDEEQGRADLLLASVTGGATSQEPDDPFASSPEPEICSGKRLREEDDSSDWSSEPEPAPASPTALINKLRRLDPRIQPEEYWRGPTGSAVGSEGGEWDHQGLVEDLFLTQQYAPEALEAALRPIREEVKMISAMVPRAEGVVEVIPGKVLLCDAVAARDCERVMQIGVKRVVNCSPQTVKTGKDYYGPGTEYMELWEDDLLDYCVMQDFNKVWAFVEDGGTCLLHCEQGVNRSGALAVALCMKIREKEHQTPEAALRASWVLVAERRGKVLTNPSFQRQLLLFARAGLRWFPSLDTVWQYPKERKMTKFREFAERVAWRVVEDAKCVPAESRWRMVVFVRDGTMRGELRMKEASFDLDSSEATLRAERRIQSYALRSLSRVTTKEAPQCGFDGPLGGNTTTLPKVITIT